MEIERVSFEKIFYSLFFVFSRNIQKKLGDNDYSDN